MGEAATSRVVRSITIPSLTGIRLILLGSPLWLLHLALPGGWAVAATYWAFLALWAYREHRRLPAAKHLLAARQLPRRFSLGSEQEAGLIIHNRSRHSVEAVIRDELHDALQLIAPIPAGRLPAQGDASVSYQVRAKERGEHCLGRLLLHMQWRGGLLQRRIALELEDRIKVYPQFLEVGKYELLAKIDERDEIVRRPRRVRGAGTDFESLRQYVPGDDMRKIDWKASARRGRLVSRVFQIEKGQQLAILIDCGRLMAGTIGEYPRLEHAFNAAVMLSYVAQKRGDSLAAATFSNRIESFLPPTRGSAIMPSVLENLYKVKLREVESDYWQVTAEMMSMLKKRSLVFMLTDVLDSISSRGLINNLYRASSKHLVLCVVLSEPQVEKTADMTAQDAEQAYAKAAACHLRQERHLALERLRSRGILVLETAPENLSIQLVRRYLEIRQADLQ